MRTNKPIIDLLTPNTQPHVIAVKIMCACSDMKERQVLMDAKLSMAVLGFITHRQGGTLQLSEGTPLRFEVQHQPPAPVSGEKVRDEQSQVCGNEGEDQELSKLQRCNYE